MNETITSYEVYATDACGIPSWMQLKAFSSSVLADQWIKDFGEYYDFYQIVKVTREPVSTYDKRKK